MARVFAIETICFFGNTDQISEFHYVMFHGRAHRPVPKEDKFTERESGFLGFGPIIPLKISRPGSFFPRLCNPKTNLIVDERLAAELAEVPNIEMIAVEFEKLFEMRYAKGDMWWYRTGRAPIDPVRYVRDAKDERGKFSEIPKNFELLSSRHQDIVGNYDHCQTWACSVINDTYEDDAEFQLSDAMLREHPVIWNGLLIVAEPLFTILEPHIDQDYFSVSEATPV